VWLSHRAASIAATGSMAVKDVRTPVL